VWQAALACRVAAVPKATSTAREIPAAAMPQLPPGNERHGECEGDVCVHTARLWKPQLAHASTGGRC
jgi:hypothetical protein